MGLEKVLKAVSNFNDENIINKVVKFSVDKVGAEDAEGILQKVTGHKFSTKAKVLMYGVGGTYVANDILSAGRHSSSIGETRGVGLANTINSPISPTLQQQLNTYDKGDQEQLTDRFNPSNRDVSAELVYALHELSGQGGI